MTQATGKKQYVAPDLTVCIIALDVIRTSVVTGAKYLNDWNVMDDNTEKM